MVRNTIIFIGEENRTNHELFQLLNWRFQVMYYSRLEDILSDELLMHRPELVVISLVGNGFDCREIMEDIREKNSELSIVLIGTAAECNRYEDFFTEKQFHRVLRPITGKRILDICKAIVSGKQYDQEEKTEFTSVGEEKQHILVVDDNAMLLRNIKNVLNEKYSVAVAASGVQAFVSIGKKMPDLILLDYEMPQMNGKEVLERLQSDQELYDIPVVFLTSADSKEIVMELLALKPAGYILKPVDSEVLYSKLEEILGK